MKALRLSAAMLIGFVAFAVVSCVLQPPYVSPHVYDGLTCPEVTAELQRLAADIAAETRPKKRAWLEAHYRALATVDALRQCYRRGAA